MLRPSNVGRSALLALCGGLAMAAEPQATVAAIPHQNWTRPEGLRPLRVLRVEASSSLSADYRPELAVDGSPGTKWVASEEASPQRPRWLVLRLSGPHQVSGLAVFGEALGNDGMDVGAVQVAAAGGTEFSPVVDLPKAPGRAWLARFPPVRTSAVRLLITHSEGPSTHTDIYEVQPFGEPVPPEELLPYLDERLAATEAALAEARAAAAAPGAADLLQRIGMTAGLQTLARQHQDAAARRARWDQLSPTERADLADTADSLAIAGARLADTTRAAIETWTPRRADIEARRQAATALEAGPAASPQHLAGKALVVNLDETAGTWDATWLGTPEAAVRGAGFAVEVDGVRLTPAGVKAEATPDGSERVQSWGQGVRVERRIRLAEDRLAVVVAGSITNGTDKDVVLGQAALLEVTPGAAAWWHAGQAFQSPGVVTVAGDSLFVCEPVAGMADGGAPERSYGGTMLLALAHQDPPSALVAGFLTGLEARPRASARFLTGASGTALALTQHFLGRRLAPGQRLDLDPIELRAEADPWEALAHYGDDIAAAARSPVRTAPTSLWCSWYAHRMAMTEDLVLANAAVAAVHLKPLGLEVMQLDHGWQRGDVTGDWVPNERFPHGLPWLAEELRTRFGLRLGVWISPTDVADVSDVYKAHPDWMLRDEKGQPRLNWRWYWVPNPNCYELDASHPDGYGFIRDTFTRLSGEGVSYYKIDFLAACGGDQFVQRDPTCTRGWGVLRRAMEAIREGAGKEAFIRYCQPPPLLSVGLADGAYGGTDLLDGGVPGVVGVTRENARALAASGWVNGRLYRREVCDLSVRMQADIEEVRLRLALMALAGCSISFSDEFQYLPPSRLQLMQKALPPGAPALRPLDLFRRSIPSVWHLRCERPYAQWDVVGLFNHEDQPRMRGVDFAEIGIEPEREVAVFEFWESRFLGLHKGRVDLELPPNSSRVLFVQRLSGRPQLLGTDMHLLGGWHELTDLAWDEPARALRGTCRRLAGGSGRVYLYLPAGYTPRFDFPLNAASAALTHVGGGVWMKELDFTQAEVAWTVPFTAGPAPKRPEPGL